MGGGGGSVSQRWLAQLAQSRGIKQSVTQPVTIALITPCFNTPWNRVQSQNCKLVSMHGLLNQSQNVWSFRSYQKVLHISCSDV